MSYVSLEKLVRKDGDSIYRLVLAAAKRANELAQGAQPLVKSESKKASTIALQEFVAGKVRYEEIKSRGKKASG
jgi:DNA-directed RNA polymerase subunit omega